MKVVKNEQILMVDVDGTLVLHDVPVHEKTTLIQDPLDPRTVVRVKPHLSHLKFVRDKAARGFEIIVWSQGGYAWAEAVVRALGLQDCVSYVMTKPSVYLDDTSVEKWLSDRVFIPPTWNYKEALTKREEVR